MRQPFPGFNENSILMEEILFRTAVERTIILMGYVLMPTHIHLMAGSSIGGKAISGFVHSIKGRIRETMQGKGKFWQDRFDDLLINTEKQFSIKLNYIHNNPVKAGLVDDPKDWPYSSFQDWQLRDGRRGIRFDFDWM